MKIELIKTTERFTGEVHYHVEIDGELFESHAFNNRRSSKDGEELLQEAIDAVKKYPESKREIVKSIDYNPISLL